MKNPASHIKKTLFALLHGSVTYNGSTVPVYEGEGNYGLPVQILIGEYSDSGRSNKHAFRYNGFQTIEIATEGTTDSSKAADDVAGLVMDILQPAPRANLLNGDDFQVFISAPPSKNLLREPKYGEKIIVRRILRYNLLINEK